MSDPQATLESALESLQRAAAANGELQAAKAVEGAPEAVQKIGLLERLGMVLSTLLNVVVFGGDPDETTSARAHREHWPKGEALIDRVFGKDHCKRTHEYTVARQMRRAWTA